MLNWPYLPQQTLWVQGTSFWLSIIGLVLGLVGFWYTIVQIRDAKSAAVQIRDEMSRVKASLHLYDSNQELARAAQALSSAKKNLLKSDWGELAQNYSDFISAVHIVKSINMDVVAAYEARLAEAIQYANKLCERIESAGSSDPAIDLAKTGSAIRQHDQLITSVNIALQGRALQ